MDVSILKSQIEKLIKTAKEEGLGNDWSFERFDLLSLFSEYCIYRNGFPFPNSIRFPKTFEFLYQNFYLPASKSHNRLYVPEKYIEKYFSDDDLSYYLYEMLNEVIRIGELDSCGDVGTMLWLNDITAAEIRHRIQNVIEKGKHDKTLHERLVRSSRRLELIDFDDFILGKKPPTIRLIKRVCQVYGCSADYILGLKDEL